MIRDSGFFRMLRAASYHLSSRTSLASKKTVGACFLDRQNLRSVAGHALVPEQRVRCVPLVTICWDREAPSTTAFSLSPVAPTTRSSSAHRAVAVCCRLGRDSLSRDCAVDVRVDCVDSRDSPGTSCDDDGGLRWQKRRLCGPTGTLEKRESRAALSPSCRRRRRGCCCHRCRALPACAVSHDALPGGDGPTLRWSAKRDSWRRRCRWRQSK